MQEKAICWYSREGDDRFGSPTAKPTCPHLPFSLSPSTLQITYILVSTSLRITRRLPVHHTRTIEGLSVHFFGVRTWSDFFIGSSSATLDFRLHIQRIRVSLTLLTCT